MAESPEKLKFAIVLSGGGARGAYEAGVFSYIRSELPREIGESPLFSLYCGTSVGAINSAFLASRANDPIFQGAELRRLWQGLRDENIYYADYKALTGFLVRSGFFMATNFFGMNKLLERGGGKRSTPFPFKSVLDTTPFVYFLRRNVAWAQIHRNIQRRHLDAVTVSATHMQSGEPALFIEKHPEVEFRRGGITPVFGPLAPKHVLASAAIPLVFPIIRINRQFFGDGSLRQNTPMSPAIHLGANRILVVGTHNSNSPPRGGPAPWRLMEAEPTIGDILGTLLDALFVDKLEYDLEQMRRINFLIGDFEEHHGSEALRAVNAVRQNVELGGTEIHEVRKIIPFVISPSKNIGA
ncbi:MAG: patatin-like phospholipase family protein, partial [bacterium]